MLNLSNISKTYKAGGGVNALVDVTLSFKAAEFVAIVGPSGCGKTTLLNIIGGLDRYTSGDLVIKGISTKAFGDADWDAYRNRSVGFVFQNYNLIGHQSVLQNVELALAISGIGPIERRRRAREALEQVGLHDKLHVSPNELSGGQMQRVAIARALVNNPEIVLCDEPTGALDTTTSAQIMDILQEISKTRLVIMVTHNFEIANTYATRIVRLLDGHLVDDSAPATDLVAPPDSAQKFKHTNMSFFTASLLSLKNLLTKKGRTITTAFAGSVGIISVALVLALSSGVDRYMSAVQSEILMTFPISITTGESFFNVLGRTGLRFEPFPDSDTIHRFNQSDFLRFHINVFTDEFLEHIDAMPAAMNGGVANITYVRALDMNILSTAGEGIVRLNTATGGGGMAAMVPGLGGGGHWQEMPQDHEFVLGMYELIGANSRMPTAADEILLVVDRFNRLPEALFANLGMARQENREYVFADFLGQSPLSLISHNNFFLPFGDIFVPASAAHYSEIIAREGNLPLTVVGILRIRPDAPGSYFNQGFVYTNYLVEHVLAQAGESVIVQTMRGRPGTNVFTGGAFTNDAEARTIPLVMGADTTPAAINIFAVDFAAQQAIVEYLEAFNEDRPDEEHIVFTDLSELITEMTGSIVNMVSGVLIGFASISLVVSSIMIGIVMSVSVIERTKEISILRSCGARKKDISRVFCAESVLIGLASGLIGVGIAQLLIFPINIAIETATDAHGIAALSAYHVLWLVLASCTLTFIAGYMPAKVAARKDPVAALRVD